MNLRSYLTRNKLEIKEFAEKYNLPLQNVHYWVKGTFRPNRFYRDIIEKATGGDVKKEDWKPKKRKLNNGEVLKDT